ncbi:MAG: hypothetical protein ABW186_07570 [Rhodanobacteraceae bacterium]
MAVATTLSEKPAFAAVDYRCQASPRDTRYTEAHRRFSIASVRSGSLGSRHPGRCDDLVAGSVLLGHARDEPVRTHAHRR